MPTSVDEKRAAFKALHESGCFVLPNPWDVGSARLFGQLGFKALASTSSGYAWSQGYQDGAAPLPLVLDYLRSLVQATDLPVNADFEYGFAQDVDTLVKNVRAAVDTGVAGLSIEDATGDPSAPLRSLEDSVQRLRAARRAIDESGQAVLLVGRAENFLHGNPDLADTLRRLRAYAAAGADCLYAPGIHDRAHIQAVVEAVAPKPVNVLIGSNSDLTLDELAALGVRRVSVGGGLARVAWESLRQAAGALAQGRFDAFGPAMPYPELNGLMRARRPD
ncbi:isocitrate lyase/PEP mutase family protein [Castellaniella hirudinis]|uniref:isocitrate lyase/PEP mutase family protein n=1 Tax=Castellaniella hirudinis TaxID=1144617 RepID=UPI0039C04038